MTEVKIESLHAVTGDGDTSQDVTSTGFGTPAGATFFWTYGTADGTSAPDRHTGFGAVSFDGTDKQWACSAFTDDNAAQTQCTSMGSTTRAIQVSNAIGTGVLFDGTVAAITDGVRITWSGTPGTAFRMNVILYGGADCTCEAGTVTSDTTGIDGTLVTTMVDMAEEPEFLMFGSPGANAMSSTPTDDAIFSLGVANGPTGSLGQGCWGFNDDDARNPGGRHGAQLSATRCLSIPSYTSTTELLGWELTATGVTGTPLGTFTLTRRTAASSNSFGWFAVATGGNNQRYSGCPFLNTDTSGNSTFSTPGFEPQFVMVLPSNLDSLGGNNGAQGGGGMGLSAIDATNNNEGCYAGTSEEVDSSNANSRFDTNFLVVPAHDDASVSWEASFVSFGSTGFTYNVSNTTTNDKFCVVLCVEIDGGLPPPRNRAMVVS